MTKKYVCRYIDIEGQEQAVYFEGNEITFKYKVNPVSNEPFFLFAQGYKDFNIVMENGLEYLSRNLPANGSDYRFAAILNDKEYIFYKMGAIVRKDVGLDYHEVDLTGSEVAPPFTFSLELV